MIHSLRYFFALTLIAATVSADGDPDEFDQVNESLRDRGEPIQIVDADDQSKSGRGGISGFDVYASDVAAQFSLTADGSSLLNVDNSELSAGFLFSEERDTVLHAGIVLEATPEFFPGLTLGVGGRAYAGLLGIENADVIGFSVGLEGSFDPNFEKVPVVLNASIYYAPDILTFGSADRIIDWRVEAELEVRNSLSAFAGLRVLQFDTRPSERDVDESIHVGLRWSF